MVAGAYVIRAKQGADGIIARSRSGSDVRFRPIQSFIELVLRPANYQKNALDYAQMDANQLIAVKAIRVDWVASAEPGPPPEGDLGTEPGWQVTNFGRIRVGVLPWLHSRWMQERIFEQGDVLCLCTGDPSELLASPGVESAANAAWFVVDPPNRSVRAQISLVGLPPVFVRRSKSGITVTSPFPPAPGSDPSGPDIEGVAQALRWGYPIDGHTLLEGVRFLPAGAQLLLQNDGEYTETSQPPRIIAVDRAPSREELVEQQLAAFLRAGRRLPVQDTFVSLSGGLDSRTALMAVMEGGRPVDCASIAASSGSLDARLARRLCSLYAIPHEIVFLDAAFESRLPDLVPEAARLTRGVARLSQAVDLHFYNCIGRDRIARISGNLGNQVGRGGVESIAVAHPELPILGPELRAAVDRLPVEPWYLARMQARGFADVLLREEAPFASVADYMIGSSRMAQLTPYADGTLLDLARMAFADDPSLRAPTALTMRARDIRHRFIGTPRDSSFQRAFLVRYDQLGRNVPINWGWRARGGSDPFWFATSALTAGDMILDKLAGRLPLGRKAARWLSELIGNPSANVSWPRMFTGCLRSLVGDVLTSRSMLESGLVDRNKLIEALDEHMAGRRDSFATLSRLFEIGLGLWPR